MEALPCTWRDEMVSHRPHMDSRGRVCMGILEDGKPEFAKPDPVRA
jgi:hypothetical protein